MLVWAIITIAILSIFNSSGEIHWPTALSITVLFVILFIALILNSKKLKKAFTPSNEGAFVGQHQILFSNEGIKSQGQGYISTREWNTVKSIELTDKMILIYLDTAYALILPLEKLESPDELYQFITAKYNKRIERDRLSPAPHAGR